MEDDIGIGRRHDVREFRRGHVGANEPELPGAGPVAALCVLEVGRGARAEVVNSENLVAVG